MIPLHGQLEEDVLGTFDGLYHRDDGPVGRRVLEPEGRLAGLLSDVLGSPHALHRQVEPLITK